MIYRRAEWMADAACRGHTPDLWFPPRHSEHIGRDEVTAICGACPVARQCLDMALDDPALVGWWAATNEHDRRRIRRQRRDIA